MRKPVIAANWKMNKTLEEAGQFADNLLNRQPQLGALEAVIAAPFTALSSLAERLRGTPYGLAAQDLFWEPAGAYTGEVSAAMLVDAGCSHVIVGHSERRQGFGETDAMVDRKVAAALQAGLQPIVCIGETLDERQAGETLEVLERQLNAGLASCDADAVSRVIVGYEPLWAIGTGLSAAPQEAQEAHAHLRGVLARGWGSEAAGAVRIQYGGSVNPGNIAALMAEEDIDGALVGGASLDAESFVQLLNYS
ncbi:MAG: triose-phosphate isomerase [Candidatus Tectomicrobia bacterium]|nr:triose-phosphate isomerase [Candidatus Tectomicrobia bacterium]